MVDQNRVQANNIDTRWTYLRIYNNVISMAHRAHLPRAPHFFAIFLPAPSISTQPTHDKLKERVAVWCLRRRVHCRTRRGGKIPTI